MSILEKKNKKTLSAKHQNVHLGIRFSFFRFFLFFEVSVLLFNFCFFFLLSFLIFFLCLCNHFFVLPFCPTFFFQHAQNFLRFPSRLSRLHSIPSQLQYRETKRAQKFYLQISPRLPYRHYCALLSKKKDCRRQK